MSDRQDKGGADAEAEEVHTVTVHDYDPVRPTPPRKAKAKKSEATDRVADTHPADGEDDE